jgi:hypothetical protein
MEELGISMTAILIAVVVNFFVGYLWYSVLFGNAWGTEMGMDMTVKPPASVMIKGMVMMVIGNFLMAYVFAHNIAAWSFVPGMSEMSPAASIGNAVVFTWLGFYVPTDLNVVAWENKSWKLFFINTAYHFVTLLVAAVIIYYV